MKFSLPWLKEHLETDASVEQITDKLTSLGLEVDSVESLGADLSAFSVAEIVGLRRHPNAERLNLCEVDTGKVKLEVVCGAPNVHLGMKAVFAPVGTVIPESGQALKRATIRGVESQGMLCSARELCLGEDHDGIIELSADAPVGQTAADVLTVEGPVIDIDITPNRSDCFGIVGVARELAAGGLGTLKHRDTSPVSAAFETDLDVVFDLPEGREPACPLFVAREFRGLKNGPSPAWLQARLTAIGLRPISALVDITNYITFDLGRPLHVFDARKLDGRRLTLRFSSEGERLEALDGKSYDLDNEITVIADGSGPVALGGIMGGEPTGCTEETTDVVLEIALFCPRRTAMSGRKLGIESDARTRFERGLDPAMVLTGAEYATRLILEICGGETSQLVVAGSVPGLREPFPYRLNGLERLAGIALDVETVERRLKSLGFQVEPVDDETIQVVPPSWRHDVRMEADIVEELARLQGYDSIPPMPVRRTTAVSEPILAPDQRMRSIARRTLAARGISEAATWSFVEPAMAKAFGNDGIRLRNPINSELSVLRPSVLPNLLQAAGRNRNRGIESVALFESGPRFFGDQPGEQEVTIGGVRVGPNHERHWAAKMRDVDVFDARADARAVLHACKVNPDGLRVVAEGASHYHPGRKGRLMLGPKTVLAEFGEIHPAIVHKLDLDARAVGFEVFLDRLPKPKRRKTRARTPLRASAFPPVDRDFAFVVTNDVPAESLMNAVRSADKALIQDVSLFDVYQGKGLEDGKKSLALAVRLQSMDRTLSESEIEAAVKKITSAAAKATGATLRM
ncbi:MAG: phenylalanine--tRNA ligase subunit beta [Geminicoccaceae bacterium]